MRKLGDECGIYLAELSSTEGNIWVLDGDLADSDGAEYFSSKNTARFIQAGIAEQSMVSTAAGMAAAGARPWVFSFAAFLCFRAYDQIRTGLSQTHLPVALVGSHAGGLGGRNGKTHVALNDIALMSTLPNIDIWSPADKNDVRYTVDIVLERSGPSYVRLPRGVVPGIQQESAKSRWIGDPAPVAIVTHGLATHWAIDAQTILERRGIQVGVLQVLKIWPLDDFSTLEYFASITKAFVVEDHSELGGLGTLMKFSGFGGEMEQMAWFAGWCGQSGSDDALRESGGLATEQIVEKILGSIGVTPTSLSR
jgi:transketolase